MKNIGIISYNIYGNFTNYGSALQSWALSQSIKKLGYTPKLVDYCPDVHIDKNILDPLSKMWDQDDAAIKNCTLTLPAIEKNYNKFEEFFSNRFIRTKKLTSANFEEATEAVDSFVCGSDTIFCIEESEGFDDGFFANYPCMRGNSIAYAASFGDTKIKTEEYAVLNERLANFKVIGLRENKMLSYVREHFSGECDRTIDPTLLLEPKEYDEITAVRQLEEKYLLLYTRRFNPVMQEYAERLAKENGWKIVEISLRATNAEKGHIMRYDAGVEEFLSLIKHAEFVVTNSFHGLMFSVQFRKQFVIFSRETGDSKIGEALCLFGISDRMLVSGKESFKDIDYDRVHGNIEDAREKSLDFLKKGLSLL